MGGIARYSNLTGMEAFLDAPDPIYGTGSDGDAILDGTSTVLGMIPVANVYTMTSDLYLNNLTVNSGVRLSPNGYRIFVKNLLNLSGDNAVIGFTTGFASTGSIMGGASLITAVSHSLGGSATGYIATPPIPSLGGPDYFKIPHNAITGYSLTASGGPTWLRGGAGGVGQPGGGIVIIAARYIAGPSSGTAYLRAPATPPAGGGVILIVSTAAALPSSIQTDVTGQNPGTVNYMQLV